MFVFSAFNAVSAGRHLVNYSLDALSMGISEHVTYIDPLARAYADVALNFTA
jgi:hypothetical protein